VRAARPACAFLEISQTPASPAPLALHSNPLSLGASTVACCRTHTAHGNDSVIDSLAWVQFEALDLIKHSEHLVGLHGVTAESDHNTEREEAPVTMNMQPNPPSMSLCCHTLLPCSATSTSLRDHHLHHRFTVTIGAHMLPYQHVVIQVLTTR
jgi:hypothetical protein